GAVPGDALCSILDRQLASKVGTGCAEFAQKSRRANFAPDSAGSHHRRSDVHPLPGQGSWATARAGALPGQSPSKSCGQAKSGLCGAGYRLWRWSRTIGVMSDIEKMRALLAQRRKGYTLPQGLYVDPEVHAFDIEAIFQRSWLQAGLESEIPAPGDYLTLAVGDSPIVVVRNQDGGVGAFFNTCRHRGAQ